MLVRIKGIVATAIAAFALIATVVGTAPSSALAKSPINTIGSPGVAIKGYDPVAYFEQGGPRKGLAKFSHKHKRVIWRFSSAQNLALFKTDPGKYEPAYGGYCAYGVAQGYLVKIEPNAWKIVGGRLYLNYDKSVQTAVGKAHRRLYPACRGQVWQTHRKALRYGIGLEGGVFPGQACSRCAEMSRDVLGLS